MLHWDHLPKHGLTLFKIGPLLVFGVAGKVGWSKIDKAIADVSMIRRDGGFIKRTDGFDEHSNLPRAMKEVADEMNIQLLEALESTERRATEYQCEVGYITKLEVSTLIRKHRLRHPKK